MPVPYSFQSKVLQEVLYGKVREDVRKIISASGKYKKVDINASAEFVDYVHLSVAIP